MGQTCRAQIGLGARMVGARFATATEVALLHICLLDALRSLPRLIQGVLLHVLPVPGLRRAQRLQRFVLHYAVAALQPVLLAHTLRKDTGNPWQTARHALVLHAQAGPTLLIRASRVAALVWALTAVVFLLMLSPAQTLGQLVPGDWRGEALALAALLSWATKYALIDPLALVALIRASLALTDPLQPNLDWEDKLDAASPAFHAMERRAVAWHVPPAQGHVQAAVPGHGETQRG